MSNAVTKLAAIGGPPLGGPPGDIMSDLLSPQELHKSGLVKLLAQKNGFYAFEGALHVFPARADAGEMGIELWNSASSWRDEYHGLADGCFFFAEDVFGGQFCLYDGAVASFDPETGEKSFLAADVQGWVRKILDEYEVLTGQPLAHQWQRRHGPIPHGQRLVPKIPFVLGGEFSIDNLFVLDAVRAMRSRANMAVQIKDLPEGAEVVFKVVE
jgi:hypothetical protein